MRILVIAEHENSQLKSATLNTLSAARHLSDDIHVLVAGHNAEAAATQAVTCSGVVKVLLMDDAVYQQVMAENLAKLVQKLAGSYSHILAPATTFGKDLMPRVAALIGVEQISDIISVESPDTFKRPIYAGNAIATVQSMDSIKLLTVRGTAFEAVLSEGGDADVENLDVVCHAEKTRFVSAEVVKSDRPELTSADVVVSGGRGVGSEENFQVIYDLADKLGAAVGASRAAVDAGYVPNDMQVGQTGKVVAPQLYIAVGISGAIQHLAGMKESKIVVAINKDTEAPIFQAADYGLVGDMFEVVPELISKL
ncbi:MAG: FAD-binding protein [Candidatus Thiodiazotropha sp.]